METGVVERVRAAQADLLLRREEELEPCVRPAPFERAAGGLDHRRHRRLVVGPENGARGVAHDAVLDDGLDRALGRHGVEMRAEEDRRALPGRLEARVERAHRRADLRAGVVLVDVEADRAQLLDHTVGDDAFLARRARNGRQLEEEVQRGHAAILGC